MSFAEADPTRALDWRGLPPGDRGPWFERLWDAALALQARYELALRSGWWEDARQVEALAALAEWVRRYDLGEWEDPPGKLGLLFELERIDPLLRSGSSPLHPERDRAAFTGFVRGLTDATAATPQA